MIKSILVAGLMTIFSLNAVSQKDSSISKEERSELKKMRKEMNLSDEQKTKLKGMKGERERIKQMPKGEQRKAEAMKLRDSVNLILNDNQEKQRDLIRKKRREFKKN